MKKLLIFAVVICSVMLMSFTAAATNQVTSIDADIIINDDGSAEFYQTWQCNFSQDTEVYYFFPDEGKYEISNLVVWDEDKIYETVSDWDTSLSFEGKAGKCGILEYGDGYELCWGITEYGTKTYYVYFKIDNLVTAYKDADATYFCLFSKNVNTRPTDVSLRLSLSNGKKLVDGLIFDEGKFLEDGNCEFISLGCSSDEIIKNGAYLTETTSPLRSTEQMAFKFIFEKGLINPLTIQKKKADKISSEFYDKYYFSSHSSNSNQQDFYLIMFAVFIGFFGPFGIVLLFYAIYKLYLRSVTKKPELCKSEPTLGVEGAYLMLNEFKLSSDENLLSLMLFDMMNKDVISPVLPKPDDPIPVSKGNVKFSINPIASEDTLNEVQKEFYRFLSLSAKEDRILDPWEIKIRAQDNFFTIRKIMDKYVSEAEFKINASDIKGSQKIFKGALSYTPNGKQEVRKILGYKKYITEYSLHNAVNYFDYDHWQTPMRYSVIFGESHKIRKELSKVYPAEKANLDKWSLNILFAQQTAKLMVKNMKHSEKGGNYSSSARYYRPTTYGSSYRGGGGFGGGGFGGRGGRSGGGTR